MPLARPIVLVYQEFATLTVQPGTPDLNCCVIGPCYYIQDYPEDKTDIGEGEFVKSGETADAGCSSTGSSSGRPDPGSNYLVLAEPPNINAAPGALLDAASVEIVFDGLYVELAIGTNGVSNIIDGTHDGVSFTSSGATFETLKVAPGDRLVMTDTANPGDADFTVVKTVRAVVSETELTVTSAFSQIDVDKLGAGGGAAATSILYRVEHDMVDQVIDDAYYTVTGQQITIMTGATGLRVLYEGATWPVNYAANIYVGYRALRQDIQDILTLENSDAIETSKVGRIDERNPLAVGAQVAFANTGTTVQVFGVDADDLTGHTSARDRISNREDVYCIIPVTDSLTGATWTPVITMWKTHCVAFSDPSKSKYRICIGSYDVLPTEKSSAPPSLVGYTMLDPINTTLFDVFVDPHENTQFVTDSVSSSHLLDIGHATVDLGTLGAGGTDTPFTAGAAPYGGAKELLGAIGEKRLRVAADDKFAAEHVSATDGNYAVRAPILKSEGATPVADAAAVTLAIDGGTTKLRVIKDGAFSNVLVNDIAHVTGCTTPGNEGGFVVIDVISDDEIELGWGVADAGLAVEVQVYRPLGAKEAAAIVALTATITATGAFANAGIGDMVYVLRAAGSGIPGMFIISNVLTDNTAVIAAPGSVTLADDADIDIAVFRPVSSNAVGMSLYGRRRLTRLRDDTATFLTTVNIGENIQIPYPVDIDPTKWDTTVTSWPIKTIVSDEQLDAVLEDLEELAPELFIDGFNGDMPYRISIDLDRTAQVTELNTIPAGLKSNRCVMVWPNECYVASVKNEKTDVQSKQGGWYLACAVGGMVAGLPSHQGFTFIGIGGIQQIFNSNFYFTDDQVDDLSENGWYVFMQESESSAPYSAHEVTTDTDTYEMGELMAVKNFDFVSIFFKNIMRTFLGRYNITAGTLDMLRESFDGGVEFLRLKTYPKIGAPLNGAVITSLEQLENEIDRVELFAELDLPVVLNKIGLHLKG